MNWKSFADRIRRGGDPIFHSIGALVLLLIVGMGYSFGYAVFDGRYKTLVIEQTMHEATLRGEKDVRDRNGALKEELSRVKSDLEALKSRMPSSPEEAAFLSEISELAKAHQIRIRKSQPTDVAEEDRKRAVRLELDGVGAYADLLRFLSAVDALRRPCSVHRFCLMKRSGNSCAVDLAINAYYRNAGAK